MAATCYDPSILESNDGSDIKILLPSNELSGIVKIKIEISSTRSVDSIIVKIINEKYSLYELPFEILFNTTNYKSGSYFMEVLLYQKDKSIKRNRVNILINNINTTSKYVHFERVTYLYKNLVLKWHRSSNPNFLKYKLYQSSHGSNSQLKEIAEFSNKSDTSFTINSVQENLRYNFILYDIDKNNKYSLPDSIIGSSFPIIAYSINKGGTSIEIYTMDIDGYNKSRLTYDDRSDRKIVFLPNGQSFIYESSNYGKTRIKHMQIDGKLLRELPFGGYFFALSPDGNNIVYWITEGLFFTDFYGNYNIRLTKDGGIPNYSPDGKWIVFSRSQIIKKIKTDGSAEIQLTETNIKNDSPIFSHDGMKIAYIKRYDNLSKLSIMNSDGSEKKEFNVIMDRSLFHPLKFKSDDKKLLYQKLLVDNGIYEFDIITGVEKKLSEGFYPSYSPDGKKILFTMSDSNKDDIYIMDSNGTNKKRLTNSVGWAEEAVFQILK